jgi:hypothetical protein
MKPGKKRGKQAPRPRAARRRAAPPSPPKPSAAPAAPPAPPPPPESSHLTAKQIQDQLGISERTFQRMAQDGLRPSVVGVGSKPALYDPITVALYMRQSIDESGAAEGDGWMDGPAGSSPHLEAYRKEKARAEKRKNELAEKRIVDVGELHLMMDAIFESLGAELGALQRAHAMLGNALLEALGRAKAKAIEVLPPRPAAPVAQGELL